MSGPRLLWPRPLADVAGFPAETAAALSAHQVRTVGDLVAFVKKQNPGMIPPPNAIGLNVWRIAPNFLSEDGRKLAMQAGDAVARHLGLTEHQRPADWTDPPASAVKTTPQTNKEAPNMKVELVKPQSLELHPEAGEVLMMSPDQYKEFLKAVKLHGLIREPLKRIKGTNTIIDGRHRRQAAIEAGFAVVPVIDVDLEGEDPVLYMLSSAKDRRHFTPGQRAAQGAKYLARLKIAAKERQKEGARKGGQIAGNGRGKESSSLVGNISQGNSAPAPKSRDEAARLSGSTAKAVTAAAKVQEKSPEVFAQLSAGEISLPAAKKAVAEPKPAASPLAHIKPSSFATKPAPAPATVPLGNGVAQYPIPFLISELEETIAWINERADVLDAVAPALSKGHSEVIQREAVRLRGRTAVLRQAINKAKDAQWEKEKK